MGFQRLQRLQRRRPHSRLGPFLLLLRRGARLTPRVEGAILMKQNQPITPPAKPSRSHYVTIRQITIAERNIPAKTKDELYAELAEAVRNTTKR
jgi:hypothetical protein